MKYFTDGDQLCITRDDFVDLQESPAVFFPLGSDPAKAVLEAESTTALPLGLLMRVHDTLKRQQRNAETGKLLEGET